MSTVVTVLVRLSAVSALAAGLALSACSSSPDEAMPTIGEGAAPSAVDPYPPERDRDEDERRRSPASY